jgi:UDP-glucose 4-epimerase
LGEYCEEYDMDGTGRDGTALRMATNYGDAPGVRFNLVVNHFVFRAVSGRPLTVYGDGSNWRPFVHVDDAAGAYAHALRHPDAGRNWSTTSARTAGTTASRRSPKWFETRSGPWT